MIETFKLKGVDIIVDYNENTIERKRVLMFLKDGVKSLNKFYEMEDAFDIVNEPEVFRKLFLKGTPITKIVNLTNYVGFCNWLGRDLEEQLFLTFGIEIVNRIDEDRYELKGSKKGFSLLKDFL